MTGRSGPHVFSIGYQGKSLDAFCDVLVAARVRVLLDVRAAAWSQRPQFRKTALADALDAVGIEYLHCKEAGNPFRPRQGEPRDFARCERLYVKHLSDNPEIVETLALLVEDERAALLCFEADRTQCHRGILLDHLTVLRPKLTVTDL